MEAELVFFSEKYWHGFVEVKCKCGKLLYQDVGYEMGTGVECPVCKREYSIEHTPQLKLIDWNEE